MTQCFICRQDKPGNNIALEGSEAAAAPVPMKRIILILTLMILAIPILADTLCNAQAGIFKCGATRIENSLDNGAIVPDVPEQIKLIAFDAASVYNKETNMFYIFSVIPCGVNPLDIVSAYGFSLLDDTENIKYKAYIDRVNHEVGWRNGTEINTEPTIDLTPAFMKTPGVK